MSELEAIALNIYTGERTKSPQDMVNNFELHKELIETSEYLVSPENYTIYTRLTSDYAIALTKIESYKKAIPFLNKALSLLMKDTAIDHKEIKTVQFYEALIFNRGICYYYLKNYKESKKDFLLLTKLYPDNISYKNWLHAINTISFYQIKNALWLLLTALLLIEIFLKHYNLPQELLLWAGALCLVTVVIMEIVILYKNKLNKN